MEGKISSLYNRFLKAVLPGDRIFWRVYSPVVRVLRDSVEHQLIRQKLSVGLDLGVNGRLLDAGCGRGDFAIENSLKVKHAIGVDFERGMLLAAKERAGSNPRVSFAQANLEKGLPFSSGDFEFISNILVLSYLSDRKMFIKDAVRVLSLGGRIGIVTPIKGASFFRVLKAEVSKRKEEGSVISNLSKLPLGIVAILFGKIAELKDRVGQWHFYTLSELAGELEAEGLTVLEMSRVYADQAVLVIAQKNSP